jgi:hypothetical protein
MKGTLNHATQGGPDGLCGIYSLINFMRSWEFARELTENHRESFRYLLRSAERLNLLTADRLHAGFEWHELCEIFNLTAHSLQEPFKAVAISALRRRLATKTNRKILEHIFNEEGEAVVSVDQHEHWVLAYGFSSSGKISVFDSDASSRRGELETSKLSRPFIGVALLPIGSNLAEIG